MNEVKRRDMGLAGALIIIAQAVTSFHSSQDISDQIEKLKQDLQDSKVEREQFFVRKMDISNISQKIDKMSDQLVKLKEQVYLLKSDFKDLYVNIEECDSQFYSCQNSAGLVVYGR